MNLRELLAHNNVNEGVTNEPQLMTAFRKFLPVVMSGLKLEKLPKIKLEKIITDHEQPTFGMYDDTEQIIYLAIENRHTLDILRTLAHELVHFKQNEQQRLKDNSGDTGSEIENEANAQAAVIMRHFNKKYPEFFQDSANEIGEARKRKRNRRSAGAAYGPGLYGGYGYYAGYSGDSSGAGGDGGGGESINRENADNSRSQAVQQLKTALLAKKTQLQSATDDQVYDIIDKIMTRIAKAHNITGKQLHDLWVDKYDQIPDTWIMKENFADGKRPQDKGDSKRHGINTKASVSSLRKTAKQGGRKGQLAHWLANMKSGRKK